MITRRQSLKRLVGVAAATLTVPMINRGWFQVFAESATKYSARAIDLVQRSTVVDMLNPFTLLGVLAPFKADKRPTWFHSQNGRKRGSHGYHWRSQFRFSKRNRRQ